MMRAISKRLLSIVPAHHAFAALTRLTFGTTGAILMFHEIQEDPDSELRTGCTPGFLDGLVRALIAGGWDFVTLDEALRRVSDGTGRRFIVLTFDDGYRDTFNYARVVLERYSAPFTMYVPTGSVTRELNAWWLGLREIFRTHDVVRIDAMERTFFCSSLPEKVKALRQTCDWIARDFSAVRVLQETMRAYRVCMEQLVERYFVNADILRRLAQNPLATIGAHASSHRALSTLDEAEMYREIQENRGFLEHLLDTKVEHLAYPYGTVQACGEREFAASSKLGFISAVTAENACLDQRRVRLHQLPRVDVTRAYWVDICAAMNAARTEPPSARGAEEPRRPAATMQF